MPHENARPELTYRRPGALAPFSRAARPPHAPASGTLPAACRLAPAGASRAPARSLARCAHAAGRFPWRTLASAPSVGGSDPGTSAPGLGSPPATSAPGATGLTAAHICSRTGLAPPASASGLGSLLPHCAAMITKGRCRCFFVLTACNARRECDVLCGVVLRSAAQCSVVVCCAASAGRGPSQSG
jgi:hypothetical protein